MSIDASVPHRSLGEYIEELVRRLAEGEPFGAERLRQIVAGRRARIVLDEEAVDVSWGPTGLAWMPAENGVAIDKLGVTDRATVLDVLDGYLEVTEAIDTGRLRIRGALDEATRMFLAIEVLLDAATRVPSLQRLAREFRLDTPASPPTAAGEPPERRRAPETRRDPGPRERNLLERLDLLP